MGVEILKPQKSLSIHHKKYSLNKNELNKTKIKVRDYSL